MKRRVPLAFRWVAVYLYAWLGWSLGHDGDTPGEFVVMTLVGSILIVYVLLADWIAQGRPLIGAGE